MIVQLGMLKTGESAEIIGFRRAQGRGGPLSCNHGTGRHQHGGRHPGHGRLRDGSGQDRRLSELGFSSGQVVEVVQNDRGMPVLVKVRDGRMAIDHTISMEIIVRRKTQ